ncbi:MAG: ATP-dependent Clp protease proteolytic subunit [archaeon]
MVKRLTDLKNKVITDIYTDNVRSNIFNYNVDTVTRRIYLIAPGAAEEDNLGDHAVDLFMKGMNLLNAINDKPIRLVLNCPGGGVVNGFGIYDSIINSNAPIDGEAYGIAGSMGAIILQACRHRAMSKNSVIMIHNIRSGDTSGKEAEALEKYLEYTKEMQKRHYRILQSRTGFPTEFWEQEFGGGKDRFLTAPKALKLDLIDAIIPEASWRKQIAHER